jgi:hypothetical protein
MPFFAERPDAQLDSLDSGGAARQGLKQLVDDCWHHFPDRRPAFSEIVRRVRELRRVEAGGAAVADGSDDASASGSGKGGGKKGSRKAAKAAAAAAAAATTLSPVRELSGAE